MDFVIKIFLCHYNIHIEFAITIYSYGKVHFDISIDVFQNQYFINVFFKGLKYGGMNAIFMLES
jgi:hypothetical protein